MENRLTILDELRLLSPLLAGLDKLPVFWVPEGYFDKLPVLIIDKVQESSSGILSGIPKQTANQVPDGYFYNLSNTILSRIKAEQEENATQELRELSPMLYSVQGEHPYEVPLGYFRELANEILIRSRSRTPGAKVLHITRAVFMRYAVAALFTGFMALGVFKFTAPNSSSNNGDAWSMNVDKELDKVSDVDMIKYLEANGENVDAVTVASNALDTNELPSQDELLNDDKALDKYLNNVNTADLKN